MAVPDPWSSTLLGGTSSFVLHSRESGGSYQIFVSLPPDFDPARTYPLLVVLDAPLCIGGAVETATAAALTGEGRPIIVVGVGTEGGVAAHSLRRLRDYLPATPAETDTSFSARTLISRVRAAGLEPQEGLGHADAFLGFLQSELLPYLRARLPVDHGDVGLLGHSAGGAFASHALLEAAEPFNRFIIGSFGAVWHGPNLPQREAAFSGRLTRPVTVFHAWGGGELKDPAFSNEAPSGRALLQRLSAVSPHVTLIERQFDDETHVSVLAHLIASGIRIQWPGGRWGGGRGAPA